MADSCARSSANLPDELLHGGIYSLQYARLSLRTSVCKNELVCLCRDVSPTSWGDF